MSNSDILNLPPYYPNILSGATFADLSSYLLNNEGYLLRVSTHLTQ